MPQRSSVASGKQSVVHAEVRSRDTNVWNGGGLWGSECFDVGLLELVLRYRESLDFPVCFSPLLGSGSFDLI